MLDRYADFVMNGIPAIARLAAVSSFPEVTKLVLSLEWTIVPIQIVLFLAWKTYQIKWELLQERKVVVALGFPLLLGIFLWSTALFLEVSHSDLDGKMLSETLLRLISNTRIGLAVITSVALTATAQVFGAFLIWVMHIPQVYFGYQGRTHR